jgi:hypothetical protein
MKYQKNIYKRGQAVMVAVLFFLVISSTIIAGIVVPTANNIKASREAFKARQSYLAADSATEDALYRLNQGQVLPSSFVLSFSDNVTASALITTNASGATEINVNGNSGITTRSAKGVFSAGSGVSFPYTAQVGTGGITLDSGTINGSVYSNGNIIMTRAAAIITGSATVANDSYPSIDQTNSSGSSTDLDFGKTAALQDVAQGFQVSTTTSITFVRVYLKKTGGVGDITLRIVSNSGSNPGGTTLASKNISASTVSTSFAYIPVPLSSPVALTPGTQYWLVLDYGSNSSSKYYTTKVSTATYANGVAKAGSWNSSTGGTWNAITPSTGDMFFDIYAGGTMNKIEGLGQYNKIRIGTGSVGNAWAYEVKNADIASSLYCQSNTYTYVLSSGAVKNCTNQTSAPLLSYPISDANINEWKSVITDAVNAITGGWTYTGNLTIGSAGTTTTVLRRINGNLTISSGTSTFGDLYVSGNLTVSGGGHFTANNLYVGGNIINQGEDMTVGITKVGGTTSVTSGGDLYLKGNFWSVGSVTASGGTTINLHSSLGSQDGFLISDGRIDGSGGGYFNGSGTSGSYFVLIGLSDCPGNCGGATNAVSINGGSGAVAVFAPYGTTVVDGGSALKQVTGEQVVIQGGSSVTYEAGLSDIDFEAGPSSGWVVESWDEVAN